MSRNSSSDCPNSRPNNHLSSLLQLEELENESTEEDVLFYIPTSTREEAIGSSRASAEHSMTNEENVPSGAEEADDNSSDQVFGRRQSKNHSSGSFSQVASGLVGLERLT